MQTAGEVFALLAFATAFAVATDAPQAEMLRPSSRSGSERLAESSLNTSPHEGRRAAVLPQKPEEWPRVFEERLNAGDLEAVVDLYDPNARFVSPRTGETLVGRERIRGVLAAMIDAKTRMKSHVVRATEVDDVAILYTDFEGTTVEPSGKTVETRSDAIEVLRRQPDGGWRLIVGDPNGRR